VFSKTRTPPLRRSMLFEGRHHRNLSSLRSCSCVSERKLSWSTAMTEKAGERSCVITKIEVHRMNDGTWRAQATLWGGLPLPSPVLGQQNGDPPKPFIEGYGATPHIAIDVMFRNLGLALADTETLKLRSRPIRMQHSWQETGRSDVPLKCNFCGATSLTISPEPNGCPGPF
jgi:hypothetical protein